MELEKSKYNIGDTVYIKGKKCFVVKDNEYEISGTYSHKTFIKCLSEKSPDDAIYLFGGGNDFFMKFKQFNMSKHLSQQKNFYFCSKLLIEKYVN